MAAPVARPPPLIAPRAAAVVPLVGDVLPRPAVTGALPVLVFPPRVEGVMPRLTVPPLRDAEEETEDGQPRQKFSLFHYPLETKRTKP